MVQVKVPLEEKALDPVVERLAEPVPEPVQTPVVSPQTTETLGANDQTKNKVQAAPVEAAASSKDTNALNGFEDGPPLDQLSPPDYFDEDLSDIELPSTRPNATEPEQASSPAGHIPVVRPLASDIQPTKASQPQVAPPVVEPAAPPVYPIPTKVEVPTAASATSEAQGLGPQLGEKDALNSGDWREFIESLQTELSPGFYSLLKTTVPLKYEGKKLLLACSNVALANPERLQEVQSLAGAFFGQEYIFQLVEGKNTQETSLIKQEMAEKDQEELDSQEVAKTSPLVTKIQEIFEGTEVIAVTPFKENGDV